MRNAPNGTERTGTPCGDPELVRNPETLPDSLRHLCDVAARRLPLTSQVYSGVMNRIRQLLKLNNKQTNFLVYFVLKVFVAMSYADKDVTLRIPATCLLDPAAVKFRVAHTGGRRVGPPRPERTRIMLLATRATAQRGAKELRVL